MVPTPTPPSPTKLKHPCSALVVSTHSSTHAHPQSYHSFIASPFSSAPPLSSAPIPAKHLHVNLLRWYDGVKDDRGMPWRKDGDPRKMDKEERSQRGYEVWVSEIMLQQTQVSTVIAYFNRWLQTFPTVAALASASIETVNEVWSGLGYYSRASRLLSGAKKVVKECKGGRMPETVKELLEIDGIGPYSAGAISSIAFGKRSAMVDGNVTRVLSRLVAVHSPSMTKPTTSFIWALADLLVPSQEDADDLAFGGVNKPGAWNEALMELGATVCTPKNPKCGECPLNSACLAFEEVKQYRKLPSSPVKHVPKDVAIEDLCTLCTPFDATKGFEVTRYPQAKAPKKVREEETGVCVLEWVPSASKGGPRDAKVLVVKRPEKGLLAGLYEFPAVDLPPSQNSTSKSRIAALHSLLSTLLVPTIPSLTPSSTTHSPHFPALTIHSLLDLQSILHVYSHQKREYHIIHVVLSSHALPETKKGAWVGREEVGGNRHTVGGAMKKVWEIVKAGKNAEPFKGARKAVAGMPGPKQGRTKGKKKQESEDDDDGFIVGSDEEIEWEEPKKTRRKATVKPVEEVPAPARKKRRIIISDSSEGDE